MEFLEIDYYDARIGVYFKFEESISVFAFNNALGGIDETLFNVELDIFNEFKKILSEDENYDYKFSKIISEAEKNINNYKNKMFRIQSSENGSVLLGGLITIGAYTLSLLLKDTMKDAFEDSKLKKRLEKIFKDFFDKFDDVIDNIINNIKKHLGNESDNYAIGSKDVIRSENMLSFNLYVLDGLSTMLPGPKWPKEGFPTLLPGDVRIAREEEKMKKKEDEKTKKKIWEQTDFPKSPFSKGGTDGSGGGSQPPPLPITE